MKTIVIILASLLIGCSAAPKQRAAVSQSPQPDGDTMLVRNAATDADVCPPNCSHTLPIHETVSGSFDVFNQDACGDLSISLHGQTAVTINCKDGSITYGKGFDKDSGAKAFWEAVSQLFKPCKAGAHSEATRKPDSEKPERNCRQGK